MIAKNERWQSLEEKSSGLLLCLKGCGAMPRSPLRGCAYGRCSKRAVPGSQYCEEHKKLYEKQYDTYTRSPDHHRRYGREWRRIRDRYVLEHPFCEECLKNGVLTPVEEVHHIVPVSRGGTNECSNLMSLCQSCHTKIHHELGDR